QPPVSLGRGRSLLSYRGARAVRARLPAHRIPHRTLGAGRAATFLGGSMQTRNVTYSADGADMIGFFAINETRGGSRPGVLVAPEAPGLDDLTRERCKRLAALGYAALGVDYHGDGAVIQDRDAMFARLGPYFADPLPLRVRANAALAALIAQPNVDGTRIAAVGYCFGGSFALVAGRGGADVKAAVGFPAGLKSARLQVAKNIRAKVLVLNG